VSTNDPANVLATVTSHRRGLPLCHGIRIVPNSVAERQTPSVGCHGGQHVSRVICGHSHSPLTVATGAGLVADQAADRKTAKYADLRAQYVFQPVSVENLSPFSSSTLDFLRDQVAESLIFQVMTERFCSSFKESRSRFNVSTP